MLMIRTLSAFVLVLGLGGFCFAEDKGANKLRSQKTRYFSRRPHATISVSQGPYGILEPSKARRALQR